MSAATVLGGADRWDPREVPAHPSGTRVSEMPVPAAPGVTAG